MLERSVTLQVGLNTWVLSYNDIVLRECIDNALQLHLFICFNICWIHLQFTSIIHIIQSHHSYYRLLQCADFSGVHYNKQTSEPERNIFTWYKPRFSQGGSPLLYSNDLISYKKAALQSLCNTDSLIMLRVSWIMKTLIFGVIINLPPQQQL